MVSLAIGAHAALNMRALDAAKAIAAEEGDAANRPSRIALVIGNGHYPDANAPLSQPINDARGADRRLRKHGFDVDVVEDATKDDMVRAVARLKSKIRPDSVVMLFFGGYGVQAGRESYMIPVDATIWKEADVRRNGVSIESVLDAMKEQGARAKLVVSTPRAATPMSAASAPSRTGWRRSDAPDNALILTSTTPGQVADDGQGQYSVLVAELLKNLNAQASAAETVFNKTRVAIARASDGEQVPSVSSSLLEDVASATRPAASGSFYLSPLAGRGRIASPDAIRVRGYRSFGVRMRG